MTEWLSDLLQSLASRLWTRERSLRGAHAGLHDCALRRSDRERPGGWDLGRCRVEPGRLVVLRPRLPRGWDERTLTVTAVFGTGRGPTADETWHVDSMASIFTIDTSEGRYEWAIVAEDAASIVTRLGQPS